MTDDGQGWNAIEREIAFPITVAMRSYLSSNFVWAARHNARLAKEIEAAHSGASRFDIEHRGLVLFAIIGAVTFLEATVNELFEDLRDEHGTSGDGYVGPIPSAIQRSMSEWWAAGNDFEPILPKYQELLKRSGHPPLDETGETVINARLAIDLRNCLVHYKPKTVSAKRRAKGRLGRLDSELRGKFLDNALMAGSGNPWWPSHALGAGCAEWAVRSAIDLADEVTARLAVTPNYKRVDFGAP